LALMRFGSEFPTKPEAPRMEASASRTDRASKAIDILAVELAKTLPARFISEFRKAHEEGGDLMALGDAILFTLAKKLSTCGRCMDLSCGSCSHRGVRRSGPSHHR
jgi:hypothetical protein